MLDALRKAYYWGVIYMKNCGDLKMTPIVLTVCSVVWTYSQSRNTTEAGLQSIAVLYRKNIVRVNSMVNGF